MKGSNLFIYVSFCSVHHLSFAPHFVPTCSDYTEKYGESGNGFICSEIMLCESQRWTIIGVKGCCLGLILNFTDLNCQKNVAVFPKVRSMAQCRSSDSLYLPFKQQCTSKRNTSNTNGRTCLKFLQVWSVINRN